MSSGIERLKRAEIGKKIKENINTKTRSCELDSQLLLLKKEYADSLKRKG